VRKIGKRWKYDFMIRGVRYREHIPEAQTKQEALQVEAAARRAVFEGRYGRQMRSTSFESFVREVFYPYVEANRKRYIQDKRVMAEFVKAFRGRAVQEIPPMLIEQWKKRAMQAELKASTINQKLSVLHRAFSLAVENGYLNDNPVGKVRRLREGSSRERVMSYEEQEVLLELFKEEGYYNLKVFFLIAVNTGMRANEVLGLKWSEIDLDRKEILLPASRTKEAKEKLVPLNSFVTDLLSQWRAECEGMETVFGLGASYPQIGDLWRRACKRVGIINLHIHDLRHTFASRLLEQGHRETDINKILGHSSLKMTKRYVHSSERSRREAVESLSQICPMERQKVVNLEQK
ncbi:MAG TPA: site-specific integrase, partial [Pyrinomonadaceae bacterium]